MYLLLFIITTIDIYIWKNCFIAFCGVTITKRSDSKNLRIVKHLLKII